ncbi:hypothetical protein [Paraburkholderia sp. GAS334]|jgi:hypothetical protein
MTFDIESLFVDAVDGTERVATSITHKDTVTRVELADVLGSGRR